jgi:hypothetical protein
MFHIEFVAIFIIYFDIKWQIPTSNGYIIINIKPQVIKTLQIFSRNVIFKRYKDYTLTKLYMYGGSIIVLLHV